MRATDKISTAVEGCLAAAISEIKGRPALLVEDFMAALRTAAGWTPDEVIEVQTRVIRALMSRLHQGETKTPLELL